MHVGSYDRNVGDNLALDHHTQHHVAGALLGPATSAVCFHLLDLSAHFHSHRNDPERALATLMHGVTAHNASVLLFGGGGLLQPGAGWGTGWNLPLSPHVLDRLPASLRIVVYAVGLNTFRGMSGRYSGDRQGGDAAQPRTSRSGFSAQGLLAAMRSVVMRAASFSVRNDGSHAALLALFPGDDAVAAKVWEVADPGMMLPARRCAALTREPRAAPAGAWRAANDSNRASFGLVALQPAWNKNPHANAGRLQGADGVATLARLVSRTHATLISHTPEKDFVLHALLINASRAAGAPPGRGKVVSRTQFGRLLQFNQHTELLRLLYRPPPSRPQFDVIVAMRGHGLYFRGPQHRLRCPVDAGQSQRLRRRLRPRRVPR